MMDKAELVAILKRLGSSNTEMWAYAGEGELVRFVFIKGAWQGVADKDPAWMDEVANASQPPRTPAGQALARLLDAGVDRDDLNTVIRAEQVGLLSHVLYMLQDPSYVTGNDDLVAWGLFEVDPEDENEQPGRRIDGEIDHLLTDPDFGDGEYLLGTSPEFL